MSEHKRMKVFCSPTPDQHRVYGVPSVSGRFSKSIRALSLMLCCRKYIYLPINKNMIIFYGNGGQMGSVGDSITTK